MTNHSWNNTIIVLSTQRVIFDSLTPFVLQSIWEYEENCSLPNLLAKILTKVGSYF